MKLRSNLLACVILSCLAPMQAAAWGHRGHEVIDAAAIAGLPEDGPVFLRNYKDFIVANAGTPDSWRSSSEPFSKIAEDPNHTWFTERLAFLKPVPRSRFAFYIALYREHERLETAAAPEAARMNVRWTGTMPYAATEQYERLIAGMRRLREMRGKGKDTRYVEQEIAFHVVRLGHYLGDGANPMHDSIHCEGWVGPNPNGYTREHALHARFESHFVDAMHLKVEDIAHRMDAPAHLEGDVFTEVLDYLDSNARKVETIFKLDKRGAFGTGKDTEARSFVYRQIAGGASILRDLIYRAWLESAKSVQRDQRPQDPGAPGYDPTTGSAPPSA